VSRLSGIGILAEFVTSPLTTRALIALPLSDTTWEVKLLTCTSYTKARKNRSWNWWHNGETKPVCGNHNQHEVHTINFDMRGRL
jgi:hypothetical protein